MSFGSIMQNIFGAAPTSAPVAPVNPNPGANPPVNPNIPNPANPTQVANPTQPLPGSMAANANTDANGLIPATAPASPLDAFKDMWETPPIDPKNPIPASMFANMDPKKVLESARKVDFTSTVTPDRLAAVAKGGTEGVAEMLKLINEVGQNGYAQSAMSTAKIVENALAKQRTEFEAALPAQLRKLSANDSLRANNPILEHPAVAPLVPAMTQMFQQRNPNATTQEIQIQVQDYFKAVSSAFAPVPEKSAAGLGETDWNKFLS